MSSELGTCAYNHTGKCKTWTLDSGLDSWTGLWTAIWAGFWTDAELGNDHFLLCSGATNAYRFQVSVISGVNQ